MQYLYYLIEMPPPHQRNNFESIGLICFHFMFPLSSVRVTQPWTRCFSGRGRTAESWTRTPSRSASLQRGCWKKHCRGEVSLSCFYHVSLSFTPSGTALVLPTYLSATVPAAPAPAKPFDALLDSQLFDAENSEPLLPSGGGCSFSQDRPRNNRSCEVTAAPVSPKRWQSSGSTQRHRARGTDAAVLYGVMS